MVPKIPHQSLSKYGTADRQSTFALIGEIIILNGSNLIAICIPLYLGNSMWRTWFNEDILIIIVEFIHMIQRMLFI